MPVRYTPIQVLSDNPNVTDGISMMLAGHCLTASEVSVFDPPRYIQNSFSLFHHRQRTITGRERQIYVKLRGRYLPGEPVTGFAGPESDAPQLVFVSEHGHSQILVASTSVVLNVAYSPDWQTQPDLAREYMLERSNLLFDVLKTLGDDEPLFCGSVTRAQLSSRGSDEAILERVAAAFGSHEDDRNLYDFTVRTTTVVDDRFFSNVTIQNYRSWNLSVPPTTMLRMARQSAAERGIEVVSDFNSRYSYNEGKPFKVNRESAQTVLDLNFETVRTALERVQKDVHHATA